LDGLHELIKSLVFLIPKRSLGFFCQLQGKKILMIVYIYDIVITSDYAQKITNLKIILTTIFLHKEP